MSVNELAALGATGALDNTVTLQRLQQSNLNNRTAVLDDLSNRVTASGQAVRQLEQDAVHLGTPARQEFNTAIDDLRAKERALNSSLATARQSENDAWTSARSKLESDFDAYSRAAMRVESAIGKPGAPSTPGAPASPSSSIDASGSASGSGSSSVTPSP